MRFLRYKQSFDDFLFKNLKIIIVATTQYFSQYGNALKSALEKRGGAVVTLYSELTNLDTADVIIVVGPQTFDLKELRRCKSLKCAIFTEQMYSREVGYKVRGMNMTWNAFKDSRYFDLIFDWSRCNCKVISKWHPKVYFFPHSYFKELEIVSNVEEKVYDIAFIGAVYPNSRRKVIMDYLKERYNVMPQSEGIWGEKKAKALGEAKIYLNLHQDEGLITEYPRLYDYISNHCFVLSEPMANAEPFTEGEDYDIFYITNMCAQIDFYLQNEQERKRISDHAYRVAKSNDIYNNISLMLNEIYLEMYQYKYKGNLITKLKNFIKVIEKRFRVRNKK